MTQITLAFHPHDVAAAEIACVLNIPAAEVLGYIEKFLNMAKVSGHHIILVAVFCYSDSDSADNKEEYLCAA